MPVLSGVAEMSTAAACQYVRDCEKLGADGFMVMPAMVYKADAAETMNHFRRVAGRHESAVDALQQPGRLSGRHHAGNSPSWPT